MENEKDIPMETNYVLRHNERLEWCNTCDHLYVQVGLLAPSRSRIPWGCPHCVVRRLRDELLETQLKLNHLEGYRKAIIEQGGGDAPE